MSYSNNWSVTHIAGMTSLEECYKWNGTNRLFDFGMLRLNDSNLSGVVEKNTSTAVWVDSRIFPTFGYVTYYGIPKFFITDKNVFGCGFVESNSSSETAYTYTDNILYPNNISKKDLQNWGFTEFPSIPTPAWLSINDANKVYRLFWQGSNSKYIGYCAVDHSTTVAKLGDWNMYTQDVSNNDSTYVDTLEIGNFKQYYDNNLGRLANVSTSCTNDGNMLNWNHYAMNNRLFKQLPIRIKFKGNKVYRFKGSSDRTTSNEMVGYIVPETDYKFHTTTNQYLYETGGSVSFYNYTSFQNTKRMTWSTNTYADDYERSTIITRTSASSNETQVFIPYRYPRFHIFVQKDSNGVYYWLNPNATVDSNNPIGLYYDKNETVSGYTQSGVPNTPVMHMLGRYIWAQSALRDNLIAKISSLKGMYANYLGSWLYDQLFNYSFKNQNFFVNTGSVEIHNVRSFEEDSHTEVINTSKKLPVLRGVSSVANDQVISRDTDGNYTNSPLFAKKGYTLSLPVVWSKEPKIWLREYIDSSYGVSYELYFGSFNAPLTIDLMELYGKPFEIKIYNSGGSHLHTFSFTQQEFPTTSGATYKDYRNGSDGCRLYLLLSNNTYRIMLSTFINGTEYWGSGYEFNKYYYLPWETRRMCDPDLNLNNFTLTYDHDSGDPTEYWVTLYNETGYDPLHVTYSGYKLNYDTYEYESYSGSDIVYDESSDAIISWNSDDTVDYAYLSVTATEGGSSVTKTWQTPPECSEPEIRIEDLGQYNRKVSIYNPNEVTCTCSYSITVDGSRDDYTVSIGRYGTLVVNENLDIRNFTEYEITASLNNNIEDSSWDYEYISGAQKDLNAFTLNYSEEGDPVIIYKISLSNSTGYSPLYVDYNGYYYNQTTEQYVYYTGSDSVDMDKVILQWNSTDNNQYVYLAVTADEDGTSVTQTWGTYPTCAAPSITIQYIGEYDVRITINNPNSCKCTCYYTIVEDDDRDSYSMEMSPNETVIIDGSLDTRSFESYDISAYLNNNVENSSIASQSLTGVVKDLVNFTITYDERQQSGGRTSFEVGIENDTGYDPLHIDYSGYGFNVVTNTYSSYSGSKTIDVHDWILAWSSNNSYQYEYCVVTATEDGSSIQQSWGTYPTCAAPSIITQDIGEYEVNISIQNPNKASCTCYYSITKDGTTRNYSMTISPNSTSYVENVDRRSFGNYSIGAYLNNNVENSASDYEYVSGILDWKYTTPGTQSVGRQVVGLISERIYGIDGGVVYGGGTSIPINYTTFDTIGEHHIGSYYEDDNHYYDVYAIVYEHYTHISIVYTQDDHPVDVDYASSSNLQIYATSN